MQRWEAFTPIRFVRRTNQKDFVTFRPSTVCSAHVGRIGGQQFVNLGSHCNLGLTIHEIGHTLGLFHEHTRTDRDQHVRVYWNNIPPKLRSQYVKNGAARRRGAYDIGSIMHYGSYEFSSHGFASLVRQPGGGYIALYRCTAGKLNLIESCSAGCYTAPIGEPDRCNSECEFGDGLYCGRNGVSGAADTLYQCTGGSRTKIRTCQSGCYHNDPGYDDGCK